MYLARAQGFLPVHLWAMKRVLGAVCLVSQGGGRNTKSTNGGSGSGDKENGIRKENVHEGTTEEYGGSF